jgi:nucleoside-diphosphate-sugar epimerase
MVSGELGPALSGIDGLVHAAGADPRLVARGSALAFFRRVNVDASARLFAAARQAGVRRAVFVTSFFHAIEPELATTQPYVRSRAESEDAALAAAGEELALCILQPSWVIGRLDGRVSLPGALVRYVRSPAPLFGPVGGSNFIAAASLAEAIAAALERGEARKRHVVGDENLGWTDIIERFAATTGRPRRVRRVPASALAPLGVGARLLTRLVGRETGVDPAFVAQLFSRDFFCDASPAERALGYARGNLDTAIAEAAAGSV